MGQENIARIDGYVVKRFAISGGGQAIASVWNGANRAPLLPGNGEANARLIVAAPKMLEALKSAIEAWPELDNDDDGTDGSIAGADMVEWFCTQFAPLARAAIAKAEGEP